MTLLGVLEQIDDVYEYETFVDAARASPSFRKMFTKKMYEEYKSKLVETRTVSYMSRVVTSWPVTACDRTLVVDLAKKENGVKRGVKNGRIERYWRNVQTGELTLQMKGQYKDNVPHGDWFFYDQKGNIVQVFDRKTGNHIDLFNRQIEHALRLNEVENQA